MPAGGDGSVIVVERAEKALVVRAKDAETGAVGFAAALPPEPSRTTVVVDASAAGALHALDDRLLDELLKRLYAESPPGWEMRLVAARTGRPDPSGAPPLAARLAARLGVGVVAPDGELIALRGGELFSAGPGAGWLGFRRGAHPEWTGPRYPAPAWQAALPREFRTAKPRAFARFRDRRGGGRPVTVTAIPAGLWVRGAGTAPLPLVDLGFGVPVEAARPIVLVGAPGERGPGVAELTAFYQSLSPTVRESAVLVPYGHAPETCATLAQGLADRLDTTVRAYHALPHYATDGTRRFAVFDETGTPERLTQTPESVYTPAGAAQPRPWAAPYAGPEMHRPGVMDVVPGRWRKARDDDEADPVVFESSIDTPPQPIAALDESAFAEPAAEERWSAVVTVDAEGVMRPVVRAAAGRGTETWTVVPSPSPSPSPDPEARSGAPEPVEAARTSAPAALRTTALPETRPATRPVPMRAESPATGRSSDRLAPRAAGGAEPAPAAQGVRDRPEPGTSTAPASVGTSPRLAETGDVPVAGSWEPPETRPTGAEVLVAAGGRWIMEEASWAPPASVTGETGLTGREVSADAGTWDPPPKSSVVSEPGGRRDKEEISWNRHAPEAGEARSTGREATANAASWDPPAADAGDTAAQGRDALVNAGPPTAVPAHAGQEVPGDAWPTAEPGATATGRPAEPDVQGAPWGAPEPLRPAERRIAAPAAAPWDAPQDEPGRPATPGGPPPVPFGEGSASDQAPPVGRTPASPRHVSPPPVPFGEGPVSEQAPPVAFVEPAPGAPPGTRPGASLGVPQPGTAFAPAAPARDCDRIWLADRISTPDERQAFRSSLGWRYDAATRAVARLLAEHPGLRSTELDEAMMTEFAAVRVFAGRDEAAMVESIRAGGHGDDRALAVCAVGGLRRLPALQGVVVRGGPADPGAADAYRPGQDLVEAAPIIALDDLDASVPGGVEILIWSATARRLDGFAEERPVPEVIFLPGTVFRVLSVSPPGEPAVRRVLLTEVPPGKTGPGHEKWAARVTGRLEEAAANRAAPPADPDDRFVPLPGGPARSMP